MHLQHILRLDTFLNGISKLSRTPLNYWAEFAIDIPLGALLIYAGLQGGELGPIAVISTILLGLVLFSLIEYSFHRWLFHGSVQIMAQGHHAHHQEPLGYDSLPFFLPALVLLTIAGVLMLLIPAKVVFLLTGTVSLCYVVYGLSHFVIHHHRFHYTLARKWAANHHIHHYHTNSNFGVTTPMWDILFGTYYKKQA